MNRIIKFRAWDLDSEKMITPNEDGEYIWSFANGQVLILANVEYAKEVGGEVEFVNDWLPINFELMQFTGLTDKNGKEIYEGDVVKTHFDKTDFYDTYDEIGEVVFRRLDWSVENKKHGNYYNFYSHTEVIGNIHEDGGLLEK